MTRSTGGDGADVLVLGGRVFVGGRPGQLAASDHPGPMPEGAPSGVAVKDGMIVAVGTDMELAPWRGVDTDVVDAGGGLVLAGFDDGHTHLRWAPITLSRLDLFGIADLPRIQEAIATYARAHPERPWVAGRGWLYAAFPGGMPTREQLDQVVPDRPAYFECFDGHSGWANSRALEAAGIDAATPDPRDGRIVRDEAAHPTGALLERATEAVETRIPEPTEEASRSLIGEGMAAMARAGITAIQDAWGLPADFNRLDALRGPGGKLPVRVRVGLEIVPGLGDAELAERLDGFAEAIRGREHDLWLRGGILKSFVDGVVEARTAYLLAPYPGTDSAGDPRWRDDELQTAVSEAHRRGWQVELHAIGTAAVRQALDAFAGLGPGAARARRHRVEHIESIHPDDIPRFAQLGVVASMQPFHAVPHADQLDVWRRNVGPAVAAHGWRIASLLRTGATLAFGSDWPVVPFDPFLELHAAVTRTTTDLRPAGGWLPEERIGIADALAAATWGSAYAEHAEDRRGSVVAGQAADLVVLDRDLLAEGPGAILGTQVRLTLVAGRVVHHL